jgi:hypothetical protein
MNIATQSELEEFIKQYPEIKMLEILMPDMNGIIRLSESQPMSSLLFFAMA